MMVHSWVVLAPAIVGVCTVVLASKVALHLKTPISEPSQLREGDACQACAMLYAEINARRHNKARLQFGLDLRQRPA